MGFAMLSINFIVYFIKSPQIGKWESHNISERSPTLHQNSHWFKKCIVLSSKGNTIFSLFLEDS